MLYNVEVLMHQTELTQNFPLQFFPTLRVYLNQSRGLVTTQASGGHFHNSFLIAFAKLRRATISFVMSVRLSVWNNSTPTGRFFMKFYIWYFFKNLTSHFKVY